MRRRVLTHILLGTSCLLSLGIVAAPVAQANWSSDPTVGLPVCTATGDQGQLDILPDGYGGTWITWSDQRLGMPAADIYLQHVLAQGVVDPGMPSDGRVVCNAFSIQQSPLLAPDGAGGVLVGWTDFRVSGVNADVYVHHVLSNGALDATWPFNGSGIAIDIVFQSLTRILADGHGGAFLMLASNVTEHRLYLHHVLASGVRDPGWGVNGILVSNATGERFGGDMVSDGAGGMLVAWEDRRSATPDIYAMHVFANAELDPAWPVNGLALCTATGAQDGVGMVGDGSGGALVAWQDRRGASGSRDIYATHVLAGGTVDPAWPADGLAISTASNDQQEVRGVSDGAHGCIFTWNDKRGADYDIYAQHVHGNGTFDAGAIANGAPVCSATGDQIARGPHVFLPDGAGGALVTWFDARSGSTTKDIYATHLLATAAPDPAWPVNGSAVCTAPGDQSGSVIAPDGSGGVVVAWIDKRNGTDYDVYAQRVAQNGTLPNVSVSEPGQPLGVRLDAPSPDPAHTHTRLSFSLARAGHARLMIWNLAGSIVRELENGELAASGHERTWDLLDSRGRPVPNGVYFVRLETDAGARSCRIAVLR